MKSEALKCSVGGWQILGAIRAVATAGEPGEIFYQVSNARFHRFPVGQIARNVNPIRRSVSRWKLSEQNFENFTVRVVFAKKQKFLKNAISCHHNSAMITDRRKFTTKKCVALTGRRAVLLWR